MEGYVFHIELPNLSKFSFIHKGEEGGTNPNNFSWRLDWAELDIKWKKKDEIMEEDKYKMAAQDGFGKLGMAARKMLYPTGALFLTLVL